MVAKKAYLLLALCFAALVISCAANFVVQAALQVSLSRAEPAKQARQLLQVAKILDSYREGEGQLRRAREMLDTLLREDPRYAPAHRELARYFMITGHMGGRTFRADSLRAAELSLQMALNINPRYADAYVLAGRLYHSMRRPAEARAALTKAEDLAADDPWLHHAWADLLIDEGDYDDAARRYRRIISIATSNKPAMMAAFEGLIRYYKRIGKTGEADAMYRKAIDYAPGNALSYGNYAVFLLCVQDNYEAAIAQSRRALEISNYGAGRYILSASLYRKSVAQTALDQPQAANASAAEAAKLLASPAVTVVASVCGEGPILKLVSQAGMAQDH